MTPYFNTGLTLPDVCTIQRYGNADRQTDKQTF